MKIRENYPRFLLNILLLVFMLMPVICRYVLRYPDNEKYYPFWATDLFAGFSETVDLYSIKIFKINDDVYPNGIDNFELRRTTDGFGFSASTSILMMGRALEAEKTEDFLKAKLIYEQNYLRRDKYCLYAIYKTRWNALDRWRNGKIISETELAKFEVKK